jgi:hypothetical protein
LPGPEIGEPSLSGILYHKPLPHKFFVTLEGKDVSDIYKVSERVNGEPDVDIILSLI